MTNLEIIGRAATYGFAVLVFCLPAGLGIGFLVESIRVFWKQAHK